jgi:hypothetical protein
MQPLLDPINATAVAPTLHEPLSLRQGQFAWGQTDLDQPPA